MTTALVTTGLHRGGWIDICRTPSLISKGNCEYYDGYYYGDEHYYGGCSAAPNLPFWGALAVVGFALTRRRKRAALSQ